MRLAALPIALTLLVPVLSAQQPQQQQQRQMNLDVSSSNSSGNRASQPKVTAEQKKLGTQLLQRAEMEAAGLPPGMRAYSLLQIASGYTQSDKGKAVDLLEGAFSATRAVDDDGSLQTRNKLQRQILSAMAPLAPDKVDEYLPQLSPDTRKQVLEALLTHYQQTKQLDHAIDLVYRISHESEFPYGAASRIIQALPPEQDAEVGQLFTQALASFRDHKHAGGMFFGGDDFGDFIMRNAKRVPPATVKEAIYEALNQALESNKDNQNNGNGQIALASDKGSLRFNSTYEYRLFQLLPVLRSIDPDEADKLIKEHKDADALLAKYPDGAASFMPSLDQAAQMRADAPRSGSGPGAGAGSGAGGGEAKPRSGGTMMSVGGPIDRNGDMAAQVQEMQRAAKIASDAEQHPQDALANAGAIQNKSFRAQALIGIARSNVKKNTSVAKSALSQVVDLAPDMPEPAMQMFLMRDAANLYLQMDETDSAKKIIEKGMALADKAYKSDANADDPNKALKAYWPSTEGYRSFLRVASKISPQWAATLLKDIADPEVKVSAESAMALQYMGMSSGRSEVITAKKDTNMTMVNMEQN